MLKIAKDTLRASCLSYVAFRVAFRETLERIALWKQFDKDPGEVTGYLCEVPFLREVPAHVQLDLLAATWAKHIQPESVPADLIDESVVYAVCETSARVVERDPESIRMHLKGGPLDVLFPVDHQLATELRNLHLNLSNDGDFLLIGQFLDIAPDEAARLKSQFGLKESGTDVLFDVLGRWHVSPGFIPNLRELLTPREIQRVPQLIGLHSFAG